MNDVRQYILREYKDGRLSKSDTLDFIRQVQSQGISPKKSCYLHPLVHTNTSDLSEQRFSSIFTGKEFFLADHVVEGKTLLPGVAYMEMARIAVEHAAAAINGADRSAIRIKDVIWKESKFLESQSLTIHIGLYPEDNGEIAYEIYSECDKHNSESGTLTEASRRAVHSRGSVEFLPLDNISLLDIDSLKVDCSKSSLTSSQCYKSFRAMGTDYGPGYQGIQEIYLGEHQALAKLSLPLSVVETTTQFILHPILMDSALQASVILLWNSKSSDAKGCLPVALESLQIFNQCPSSLWAWIRYTESDCVEDNMKKLDIDLCDDQRNIVVAIRGVTCEMLTDVLPKPKGLANQKTITSSGIKLLLDHDLNDAKPEQPPAKSFKLSSLQSCSGVESHLVPAYPVKRSLIPLDPTTLAPEKEKTAASKGIELFDHGQGVFRIRICDPVQKNLLTKELISGLSKSLVLIHKRKGKVILLTGDDANFLSGDINEQGECIQAGLPSMLAECEIPVIAVIKGRCTGMGWLIGVLCDFMVYSDESVCQYHRMTPDYLPSIEERTLYCRRFGQGFGRELLYSGRAYFGQNLQEQALGVTVLPADDVDAHALELGYSLAKSPRESLVQLKKQLAQKRAGDAKNLSDPREVFIAQDLIEKRKDEVEPTPLQLTSSLIEAQPYTDGIILLNIRDRKNKNNLSEPLLKALEEAFEQIKRSGEYKVLVITGENENFLASGPLEMIHDMERRLQRLLSDLRLPVIAAIQGDASGSGWLLGLLCDEAVHSETAKYSYRSLVDGRVPSVAAIRMFPYRLGHYWGNNLLYTGKEYSGLELKERTKGLTIVPAGEVKKRAMKIARGWAAFPRPALTKFKKTISHGIWDSRLQEKPDVSKITNRVIDYSSKLDKKRQDQLSNTVKAIHLDTKVVKAVVYENGVIAVTLCDHENKNTFSEGFVRGVAEVFEHIKTTPEYKVVVLTGFDHYFVCGGTKEGLVAIQKGTVKYTDFPICDLPLNCDIPVIAAMQGHSIGAGFNLGLFCDLMIFSEESVYCSKFMELGFTPGAGSTLIYPHWLGEDLANDILFTARPYKGSELKKYGITIPVRIRSETQKHAIELANCMALSARQDLVELKTHLCWNLRNQLEETQRQELAMHQKTFVNNPEVFQRIHSHFDKGLDAHEESSHLSPAETLATQTEALREATLEFDESILASIRKILCDTLAQELHMEAGTVDEEVPFMDMGLDSVSGVTWVRKINKTYDLDMAATTVYNYPSIRELAEYVFKEGKQQGIFLSGKEKAVVAKPEPPKRYPRILSTGARIQSLRKIQRGLAENSEDPLCSEGTGREKTTGCIAIIGTSGRFPKAATVAQFWDNLANRRNCVSEIPTNRWPLEKYYDADPKVPGKTTCKWMGSLEDVDRFDPLFFNISPLEAQLMDPQQRLFLEICWHSIEDAGYAADQLAGSKCGVFAGCAQNDYDQLSDGEALCAQGLMGTAISILAARISYFLNLQGPCQSIDTACSSSLVAIANACDSLRLGASDWALAGGVCVLAGPAIHIMASKAGMLSTTGRCFTFDQRADGFVPGEGGGVVLLKRLEDAKKDDDSIYAVIRGWGVNQDGKTNGITAPNPDSQMRLEKDIYEKYGIKPEEIQLIEAHGTGTKLGDPIEIEGLVKSFRAFTDKNNYCALGSVKSNIGHLLTASGIAGVIKLLMALKHRQLPPTIHFDTLNEHIQLKGTPFFVNEGCKDWVVPKGQKRRAAISSFGFSGTNSHMVIEEYVEEDSGNVDGHSVPCDRFGSPVSPTARLRVQGSELENKGPCLIVLSAKNEDRLRKTAKNLYSYITVNHVTETVNLRDLAYTLQVGRQAMEERLAFVVKNGGELLEKLRELNGKNWDTEDIFHGRVKANKSRSDLLIKGRAGEFFIRKSIEEKQYDALAQLWVSGVGIDWALLYGKSRPRRISLPTYPFARERYWISKSQSLPSNLQSKICNLKSAMLHPLVHENTSNFEEQRFSSIFTGEEYFLADHVVRGQKVLPAVAYLEMAREAVKQATSGFSNGSQRLHLNNVEWARPIAVGTDPQEVKIGLFPEATGKTAYEIYTQSQNVEDEPLLHSQGVATLVALENIPSLNLGNLQARLSEHRLNPEACYEAFKKMGIEYGPVHQGLTKMYGGDNEVLAKLTLPACVFEGKDQFILHPSLLDSALQASIGLYLKSKIDPSLSAYSLQPKAFPFIPFALDRLEIIDRCPESVWAWIRLVPDPGIADNTAATVQKLDIDLCDDQGIVSVRMKGLETQTMESIIQPEIKTVVEEPAVQENRRQTNVGADVVASKTERRKAPWDRVSYICRWEEKSRVIFGEQSRQDNVILIIYSESSSKLKKTVLDYHFQRNPPPKMIQIQLGLQTQQLSDNEWRCGVNDQSGFETCLKAYPSIDCIVFVPALQEESRPIDFDLLIESQQKNEIQLFRIIKLLKQKAKRTAFINCYILTLDNYKVDGTSSNPFGGGNTGLAYSIAQSDHRFLVRNIDISTEDLANSEGQARVAKMISKEPASDRGEVIKLRSTRRYQQTFFRFDWGQLTSESALKERGVYIILGGSGTVGGIITRYLIQRYHAKVVWIGRKPKNSKTLQDKIGLINELGNRPFYIQADITDLDSMKVAVSKVKNQFPRIDGAVFSGMVFKAENSLAKTTESDFRNILDVKTKGSLIFYTVFREEPLDFMCYFSSAQSFSFSGATKLSAYATGITFSDTFIQSIQKKAEFPVGGINWGIWKSSLTGTSNVSQNIASLEDAEGFRCFERFTSILQGKTLNQVICLKASEPVQKLMNCSENEMISICESCSHSRIHSWESNHGIGFEKDDLETNVISQNGEFTQWMVKLLFSQIRCLGIFSQKGILEEASNLRKKAGVIDQYDR